MKKYRETSMILAVCMLAITLFSLTSNVTSLNEGINIESSDVKINLAEKTQSKVDQQSTSQEDPWQPLRDLSPEQQHELQQQLQAENSDAISETTPQEISRTKSLTKTALSQEDLQSTITDLGYLSDPDYTVDFWLLNFTWNIEYLLEDTVTDHKGLIQYDANSTFSYTIDLAMPVVLMVGYENTVGAGNKTTVTTMAFSHPDYRAFFDIDVTYTIDYKFWAKFLWMTLPGPKGINDVFEFPVFDKRWEFDTPLNKKPLEKFSLARIDIPSGFPLVDFTLGLTTEPNIESKFYANIFNRDSQFITSDQLSLHWDKDRAVQKFTLDIDESYSSLTNTTITDMLNLDMDTQVSLKWYLSPGIKIPIIGHHKLDIFIFELPLANVDMHDVTGTIPIQQNVQPVEQFPVPSVLDHAYNDTLGGDGDGIIEPGEYVNLTMVYGNYGLAPGLYTNISTHSWNVTTFGHDYISVMASDLQEYYYSESLWFKVPADFIGHEFWLNVTFEYLNPSNRQVEYQNSTLWFRVVQPGIPYAEVNPLLYTDTGYEDTQWDAGETLKCDFNLTNRGTGDITGAQVEFYSGYMSDTEASINLASSGITNITSITEGSSAVLGTIDFSSTSDHEDGVVTLYFLVYYNTSMYLLYDWLKVAVTIHALKPELSLLNSAGLDQDGDAIYEAGEFVELEFTFQNIGTGNASYVLCYLTTESAELNITKPTMFIANLETGQLKTSTRGNLTIPWTVRNQTITMTLYCYVYDARNGYDIQEFQIIMEVVEHPPPEITVNFYDILDEDDDGLLEANETAWLWVNIDITGDAINVYGNLSTKTDLYFYNRTSIYGSMSDENSNGDGWYLYIPPNFEGGEIRINVTIMCETLSGREVVVERYMLITFEKGDLTQPDISMTSSLPSEILVEDTLTIDVDLGNPKRSGEFNSSLGYCGVLWSWNGGDFNFTVLEESLSSDTLSLTLDLSQFYEGQTGTLEFYIIVTDQANNFNYVSAANDEPLVVNVYEPPTPPSSSDTSVPPSSSESSSSSASDVSDSTSESESGSKSESEPPVQSPAFQMLVVVIQLAVLAIVLRRKKY